MSDFWYKTGDKSLQKIIETLESIDVTPYIYQGCNTLIKIANIFDILIEPIHALESIQNNYKDQQKKLEEKAEFIKTELNKIMPQIEKSIENLTWDSNEDKHIKADEAVEFIKRANLHIPIIQEGFDKLGEQIAIYMQSINKLIETLNEKNKTLPKKPKIPLRPIQKLINHFKK